MVLKSIHFVPAVATINLGMDPRTFPNAKLPGLPNWIVELKHKAQLAGGYLWLGCALVRL